MQEQIIGCFKGNMPDAAMLELAITEASHQHKQQIIAAPKKFHPNQGSSNKKHMNETECVGRPRPWGPGDDFEKETKT